MNLANSITLARFPLLILLVWMLYTGGAWGRFLAVPGIVLLIGMDAFDGIVARRRNETSLLGSVLDIAADRAVEIVLWVVFASLNLISIVIPVIFIVRGALTLCARSVMPVARRRTHR